MNVIFLDIDGVMNSDVFYRERYKREWFKHKVWFPIKKFLIWMGFIRSTNHPKYKSPKKWETYEHQLQWLVWNTCKTKWGWLSNFCNEADVKICVSSVWKTNFSIRDENNKIDRFCPEKWEDALQALGFKAGTYVGVTGHEAGCRGNQIEAWLERHPEVTDYAILDDDADMLSHQFKRFHFVDRYFGLSPNYLYRIGRQFKTHDSYGRLVEAVVEVDKIEK